MTKLEICLSLFCAVSCIGWGLWLKMQAAKVDKVGEIIKRGYDRETPQ